MVADGFPVATQPDLSGVQDLPGFSFGNTYPFVFELSSTCLNQVEVGFRIRAFHNVIDSNGRPEFVV